MTTRRINRRSFVAGAAAAAAGGVLAGSFGFKGSVALGAESPEKDVAKGTDEYRYTSCRGDCGGGCRIRCVVRDGNVVYTGSSPDWPVEEGYTDQDTYRRICVKGLSYSDDIYCPDRLKYPMKRAGERGENKWEQITWDEAIDTVCSKFKQIQADYGNTAILTYAMNGNMGLVGSKVYRRLFALMGTTDIHNTFDMALAAATENVLGAAKQMGQVAEGKLDAGANYNAGNEQLDLENSNTVVFWGYNPTQSDPQQLHAYLDIIDRGGTWITIDPNFNGVATKSKYWLPLKPATDAAMGLGLMSAIVEQDLVDVDFVRDHSVAPLLVKASDQHYLRKSDLDDSIEADSADDDYYVIDEASGEPALLKECDKPAIEGTYTVEGEQVTTAYSLLLARLDEYPVEACAETCGVDADAMREIARVICTEGPTTWVMGYGMDHYANSMRAYQAALGVMILSGQIGKPGCSPAQFYSVGALFNWPLMNRPEGAIARPQIPSTELGGVLATHKYYDAKTDTEWDINPKALFVPTGNPLANWCDRNSIHDVIDACDLIVVCNMTLGDATEYADIVLPIAHPFEHQDIHAMDVNHPYCMYDEKVIDPLYECKPDLEIAELIANGMGLGDSFDYTEDEWMEAGLDSDLSRQLDVSLDSLKEAPGMMKRILPSLDEGVYVYANGGNFGTATGRAQFYWEKPKPNLDYGQDYDPDDYHLPKQVNPIEAYDDNPLTAKYPLKAWTEGVRWSTHTSFRKCRTLRELDPEPTVFINPVDAQARGIEEGDMVRCFNDRGDVTLKAILNPGQQPGQIDIPRGWHHDQFVEGHYQQITHAEHDPICINNNYYDVLVEVEKA